MVKFPDSDEWTDVDDLSDEVARSIGYDGAEHSTYLYLYPTAEIPEIEVQLKVTDELEGFTPVEKWSDPFFPGPVWNEKQVNASTFTVRKSGRVRARNADGTFRADDPRTPDVNEAWVEADMDPSQTENFLTIQAAQIGAAALKKADIGGRSR